jgi:phytoene dehydrogenase-like protein
MDAEHVYRDLLPDPRALRRASRAEPSMSGFAVMAGVRGLTPGIAHHMVWFPHDQAREFRQLTDDGTFPDDPTIYACVSSLTDPTQAPAGDENWFILVNAPHHATVDADAHRDLLLDRLAGRGVDLRDRLRFTETITPQDLAARYRAPGGSIYGTSSNGRRAAFLRPANRGPRRGLYLVGGSSHPGGGLPLVAMSARIVADLVREDRW